MLVQAIHWNCYMIQLFFRKSICLNIKLDPQVVMKWQINIQALSTLVGVSKWCWGRILTPTLETKWKKMILSILCQLEGQVCGLGSWSNRPLNLKGRLYRQRDNQIIFMGQWWIGRNKAVIVQWWHLLIPWLPSLNYF